jgi:hypothetical protein
MQSRGPAICGRLIGAYDAIGTQIASEEVGKRIVWDMRQEGRGAYRYGEVCTPDRGHTHDAR